MSRFDDLDRAMRQKESEEASAKAAAEAEYRKSISENMGDILTTAAPYILNYQKFWKR